VSIRRKKDQTYRTMVSISSRTFSMSGGVGRRELCLRTGEQQHQAYYRRGGVLIIDNFAHSSRAAAIICFAFVTTLQDRPRFDEHSQRRVLCLSYRAISTLSLVPTAMPCSRPPRLSFLSPATPPSSLERRKHLLSDSSHCPLESQHRLRVYTPLPSGA